MDSTSGSETPIKQLHSIVQWVWDSKVGS